MAMAASKKGLSDSPPDGGWGWMIVIGCFLVTICTRAVTRCISIFFVEFQTYFAQDYARTAWIHSIVDCATMLCAPLGSFISNHVSCQLGIMLGGLLASAGLILSSFATSLEHLYLSLGVLTGLGFALSYSPAIAMVGKYFNKRKALAYGIAMSGSGIGTFILAPVVQLLIEQFSWRGALLILGGFVLNLCVCGALMRPIAIKEDRQNVPEFPEQEFEVQEQDLKPWSACSPLIKVWSHKCLCQCSWQEYKFLLMPDFVVLAVSVLFMAYGCSPLFVYLVPYALRVGVSHQQAAFLMSILGVIDIIGNITFGWLTDRRCLKKHRYVCYLIAVGMDGLCCLFLPVLQSFLLLVPFSFTFGYFDGAYVTLIPVVTADVVGTASLSSALGVVYFLHAIPYLISPPVAGWLVDTTGSYTASFLLCGFSMIFSSVLLCCARLAKKIKWTASRSAESDADAKQEIWTNGTMAYSVTGELDQKGVELLTSQANSYTKR
ncbi:monocarboxylate transporter 12 [Hemicordylus capensis]|uniref:monocarboxylate transporter 12 n=1 Tax=Hemicordylus capensis TaxID=884348 RepID=UPI002303EF6F|nr:monocarboxylate transporter 12 [Hemicordylus capensis]XP_053160735.1 monocarboxylate transporter 12 [Hemicordylus capensis]XP_053160736.1 monocarboxylate transporter 12 [Hemicordylus capensis]XP_053160737.1 monocarboxylate transporter 12 [Hemicordylus capensis]XP_053160739.1 monocarboxylate transporter 12 [Hemicordylus capensis]XP_053160740.1 monocarboxylate transporter 12 [Hemicordylus capensis]XP_053160741.1 monocarboxylate transporter 12 [Hemicordylus capensis]XP_053160742.1 monocarbox